jgi:hypothetical protein
MNRRVSTLEEARELLVELGYLQDDEVPSLREIPVGFRLRKASVNIGSADIIVTRDGAVRRIPAIVRDDEIRL